MKQTITIFAVIILTVTGLFLANQALTLAKSSATAGQAMLTANQLYETGQFVQAAQAYEQLVNQGYSSGALYYNLGNAYFKQDNYGQAILNYRRAEQLAPRNADIEANLNMARAQMAGSVEASPETNSTFIKRIAGFTQEWITLNELAFAALAAWIGFVLLVIIVTSLKKGYTLREGVQYVLVATSLVLALGLVGLGARLYVENVHPEGVVVANEANVTSGPGSQYVTEFTLPGGVEVDILETRENWVRLAVPNSELQGWTPANAVTAVTPVS